MTLQRWRGGALLVLVGLVTAGLTWAGTRPVAPGPADIGFAQDMSAHHAQAVQMAGLVLERTEDDAVTALARDILLTQQAQIGQMQGWLDLWGAPMTRVGPRMGWMSIDGVGMEGRMPGMASPDEIDRLRDLRGDAAERLFLGLMIDHHQSGVAMASAAAQRASLPAVRRLAETMVAGQQVEIDAMRRMLEQGRD